MKKEQGQRKIRGIIIGTAIVVILAGAAIFYAAKYISLTSDILEEKRAMLAVWEGRDKTLASLQRDYEKVEKDLPLIEKALPKEEELIDFVARLERKAEQEKLGQTIHFEPKAKAVPGVKVCPSISYVTDLSGDLDSFIAYLSGVEKLPYFIQFNKLDIKSKGNIKENLEAQLKSKIYTRE